VHAHSHQTTSKSNLIFNPQRDPVPAAHVCLLSSNLYIRASSTPAATKLCKQRHGICVPCTRAPSPSLTMSVVKSHVFRGADALALHQAPTGLACSCCFAYTHCTITHKKNNPCHSCAHAHTRWLAPSSARNKLSSPQAPCTQKAHPHAGITACMYRCTRINLSGNTCNHHLSRPLLLPSLLLCRLQHCCCCCCLCDGHSCDAPAATAVVRQSAVVFTAAVPCAQTASAGACRCPPCGLTG
jgi:hypothetical protein